MRLLIDQMWPATLAEQLRRRQHDVVAVAERPEVVDRDDAAVFALAQEEGRAVFTENVGDYIALAKSRLEAGAEFHGLIMTSNAAYPRGHPRTLGRVIRRLDRYLRDRPKERACVNCFDWL